MVRAGRNQQCPCGSGRKVKYCCGQAKGPSDAELAKAALAAEAKRAALHFANYDEPDFCELYGVMLELPTVDHSMLVPLPRLITPEIERLRRAIDDDDIDGIDAARPAAATRCDTPTTRLALLEAAYRLRDEGRISADLAAMVAVDLARRESDLIQSSLVEAVALDAGAVQTASGLVVATR
jgi:hypothetical protein